MGNPDADSAFARERQDLGSLLHDEILQGIIAARWALDDIEPGRLPPDGARALAEAIQALDRTQEVVRDQIIRLQAAG